MKKLALYLRVSTDEQAKVEEGSIKNQEESLRRYVEGENLKHSGKWGFIVDVYTDDGYSAKSLNRPAVRKLLFDISKGRVDTVMITEISRLSRLVKDWIDLRAFFQEHQASFISARQSFDTSSAMGRAMLNFAIEFSQLEREQTAERVKISYHARASRGLWPGGPIPWGYDPTDRPGHIQLNAAKQIIGKEIFDILLNQAGYASKAVALIQERGFRRDRNLPWDEKSLCRWVRSRALIGESNINQKNRKKDQAKLPESERCKIVKAVWEPLIEKEIWERANALLNDTHHRVKPAHWKYNEYILTKLLECPKGTRLVGGSGWGRSGIKYASYKHRDKAKCGCHVTSIPAPKIEAAVIKELRRLIESKEIIEQLTQKANDEFKNNQPNFKDAMLSARQRLDGVIRRLEKVTDEILDAKDSSEKHLWLDKSQRLQSEKESVETELAEIQRKASDYQCMVINAESVRDALRRFGKGFDDLPAASKVSLIKSIVDKVEIKKDEIVIKIKDPGFKFGHKKTPLSCDSEVFLLAQRENWGD